MLHIALADDTDEATRLHDEWLIAWQGSPPVINFVHQHSTHPILIKGVQYVVHLDMNKKTFQIELKSKEQENANRTEG